MFVSGDAFHFFVCFGFMHLFFALAIQLPVGRAARYLAALLSLLSSVASLKVASNQGFAFYEIWTMVIITVSLRAFGSLIIEGRFLDLGSLSMIPRLRVTIREWINVRLQHLTDEVPLTERQQGSRLVFATAKLFRILILYAVGQLDLLLAAYIKRRLGFKIWDLAPEKQAVPGISSLDGRHLLFRSYESVRWILRSYWIFTAAHDMFAIIFVSILRWDRPDEWPPLFGNISDAYSLRRFWGVFWHRLNLGVFETYMPSPMFLEHLQSSSAWLWITAPLRTKAHRHRDDNNHHKAPPVVTKMHPALRALWIFAFSAGYHALANIVIYGRSNLREELRFFLANFALCYIETLFLKVKASVLQEGAVKTSPRMWERMLGYLWVSGVFFAICPAWRWSISWRHFQQLLEEKGLGKLVDSDGWRPKSRA